MTSFPALHHEIDTWFSEYFDAFIEISAGETDPSTILLYWSVPLHTSSPKHSAWLKSPEEVVGALNEMQVSLKRIGYARTEPLDREITVYSANAGRVAAIMSRRRGDGTEVDRAAVSFELRRANGGWIIISTTAQSTQATRLHEVWGLRVHDRRSIPR